MPERFKCQEVSNGHFNFERDYGLYAVTYYLLLIWLHLFSIFFRIGGNGCLLADALIYQISSQGNFSRQIEIPNVIQSWD